MISYGQLWSTMIEFTVYSDSTLQPKLFSVQNQSLHDLGNAFLTILHSVPKMYTENLYFRNGSRSLSVLSLQMEPALGVGCAEGGGRGAGEGAEGEGRGEAPGAGGAAEGEGGGQARESGGTQLATHFRGEGH